MGVDHMLGHPHLLVDASGHHRLVDALIRPADEVAVQVQIHIIQRLDVGQGLIDKDVVHIEGMAGKLQAAVPQQLGAVDNRVHQQVLRGAEAADGVPGDDLVGGEYVFIPHHLLGIVLHVLIDVVGDEHVHRGGHGGELPQLGHHLAQGVRVQPVVGVHHLIIQAPGVADALIDPFAVAAVLLMDGPDDVRVLCGPFVALGGGVVFGGTVVHQDDLRVLPGGEQGFDAMVHIGRGIVAGDGEGDNFIHIPSLQI